MCACKVCCIDRQFSVVPQSDSEVSRDYHLYTTVKKMDSPLKAGLPWRCPEWQWAVTWLLPALVPGPWHGGEGTHLQPRCGNYGRQVMGAASTGLARWAGAHLAKEAASCACHETLTFNLVLQPSYKGRHVTEPLTSSNRAKPANIKTETAVALVQNYKYEAQ